MKTKLLSLILFTCTLFALVGVAQAQAQTLTWVASEQGYTNDDSTDVYLLNVAQSYEGNPEGSVFVKGLRKAHPFEAYFQLSGSAGVKSFFSIFDELTDGIRSMEPAKRNGNAEYYQLDGTKRTSPQRGFNIIRTKEGKTHKVILQNSSGNFAEQ